LVLAFAATALAVLTPPGRWWDLGLLTLLLAGAVAALRLPVRTIAHRFAPALPLLLLIALSVPLSVPGEPLATLPLGFTVTREGALLAVSLLARASLAVLILATLTSALSRDRLMSALRGIGLPSALLQILLLAQRQLGLFAREWSRVRLAVRARSPRRPSPLIESVDLSRMGGMILARSLERSERVHRAMVARGGAGAETVDRPAPMRLHDWLALALGLTALLALHIAAVLLG
jgi:cobalt/nickel transport system permease protein